MMANAQALPNSVQTREYVSLAGSPFNPANDTWRLRTYAAKEAIRFWHVKQHVSADLLECLRRVFTVIVMNESAYTARGKFYAICHLVKKTYEANSNEVSRFTLVDVTSWISMGPSKTLRSHVKSVAALWRDLGIPGWDEAALELVEFAALPPDPAYLETVLTRDPRYGPFRSAEDEAVRLALDEAYNSHVINVFEYTMVRTFRALGLRPDQLCAMKVSDLERRGATYRLTIPKAKQRDPIWRTSFMPPRPIALGLGHTLDLHIASLQVRYNGHPSAFKHMAMFPQYVVEDSQTSFKSHHNPQAISNLYRSIFERIGPVSPCDGEMIFGTPKRDRATVGTYLAMMGCSESEIAAVLGHSKAGSCRPYVKAGIDHHQRMEKLLGEEFIPISDRFLGRLVERTSESTNKVEILNSDAEPVGTCGGTSCNAIGAGAAPLACYTCRKFNAWSDGPHESLLEEVLSEQRKLFAAGHEGVAGTLTVSVLAIRDLIERIDNESEA